MSERPKPKSGEPGAEDRCPNDTMPALSAQMIERAATLRARRAQGAEGFRMDPDAELVERWQGGDPTAFEALVHRHQSRVYRLLLRMLGSREEAEDVAQEAFLSLHRHGHRFRRESRFSTFLYRVATNAALNRRRTLGRNRNREDELAVRQAAGDDLPATPPDPAEAVRGAQLQVRIQDALLELSPDLRAAIVLYDIEGQSYREIARVLEIPEGTVKSRIHRARSALRMALKPWIRAEQAQIEGAES